MLRYAMVTLMHYGWVFFPFLFFSQGWGSNPVLCVLGEHSTTEPQLSPLITLVNQTHLVSLTRHQNANFTVNLFCLIWPLTRLASLSYFTCLIFLIALEKKSKIITLTALDEDKNSGHDVEFVYAWHLLSSMSHSNPCLSVQLCSGVDQFHTGTTWQTVLPEADTPHPPLPACLLLVRESCRQACRAFTPHWPWDRNAKQKGWWGVSPAGMKLKLPVETHVPRVISQGCQRKQWNMLTSRTFIALSLTLLVLLSQP